MTQAILAQASAGATDPNRVFDGASPVAKCDIPSGARIHALGWHLDDLSAFEFRLTVSGRPFTLKNSKKVTTLVCRPSRQTRQRCWRCKAALQVIPKVLLSTEAEAYVKDATQQMQLAWHAVFACPIPEDVLVNAAIVTYRATRHRNDASNLYQAPEDAMQAAGVLTDDYQVAAHDGSRRLYDKDRPRVEITLTPYRGEP